MTGYSDRISHALAFAAKYHDHEVRRGSATPYMTAPPNVAIILTRYGQDDDTVVAGILHAAVEAWARSGSLAAPFDQRVAEKFGPEVIRAALEASERRCDDEGIEMSAGERRADLLARLEHAGTRARWVCAAEALHTCGALLADIQRTPFPELVWARGPLDREGTLRRHRELINRLDAVGFAAPILAELRATHTALELSSTSNTSSTRSTSPAARPH